MKVEIKLDEKKQPFFIERRSITSGKIVRSGFPDYGVVFSGIGKPNELDEEPPPDIKPSEDDFDVNLLSGAIIGWRSAADEEDHKYFDILGGYFYHQGGPNDGKTTKAFGIVKENDFGVTEGGTTTVNDNWELAEPASRGLDEKEGGGGGWTFIVAWKEGGEFPHSSTQLKICVECPEIDSFVAEFGDCLHDAQQNKLRKKVTFKASISGGEPAKWTCEFGDGKTETGAGMPPAAIEHLYDGAPANTPKMTVEGQAPCKSVSQEADFSGFEACPPCPKVKGVSTRKFYEDDQNTVFEFTVEIEDGAPDKYEWEWGDGTAKETTTSATVTHSYARQVKNDVKHNVKVTLTGPHACHAEGQTSVEVPEKPIPVQPPPPCTWMGLLIAFLLAMAGGNLILWIASALFYPANDNSNVIIAFFIFAVLGVVGIFLWLNLAKKEKCARPGTCEWQAIAWVVLLAAALVALYIVNCCPAGWWILIILLFAAAIFLLYTWWKKCSADIKAMLLLIAAAAIAAFLVSVFIARTVFEACL